jgi:hypothetical protein
MSARPWPETSSSAGSPNAASTSPVATAALIVGVSMLMIFRSRSVRPLAASTLLMASWWFVPRNIAILRPLRSLTDLTAAPLGTAR